METGTNTSNQMGSAKAVWRRPELRKLPILATAGAQGKQPAVNASDGVGSPKTADSNGQRS